jgi:N-acetylglucosamine-6-phosphate deacetylase
VLLRSERIVCPERTLAGEVVIQGNRIVSAPSGERGSAAHRSGELIDLGDRWLVPGYVDTHVHGGGGAQCNTPDAEEIGQVASFHARHGTTALLATTVPAPVGELCLALDAVDRCKAPNLLGAHLEGPFLSRRQPGALDPSHFLDPDPAVLQRLLAIAPGRVRLMTLAPELPGGLELVEQLVRGGVVASMGHTRATYAEAHDAVSAGASAATHVFNGMPPLHHRAPGVLGAVLDLAQVSCELICDAFHVDPAAMRLLYRAKGASGIRLVTDAMAAAGMPDGEYRLTGRAVTVSGGLAVLAGGQAIAGSTLTMEEAVQKAVGLIGVSVEEAILMASTNAARLLGLQRRKGAIAAGCDADLVVLSERLAVEAVMVAGRWVLGPP